MQTKGKTTIEQNTTFTIEGELLYGNGKLAIPPDLVIQIIQASHLKYSARQKKRNFADTLSLRHFLGHL